MPLKWDVFYIYMIISIYIKITNGFGLYVILELFVSISSFIYLDIIYFIN